MMIERDRYLALDAADRLARLRQQFELTVADSTSANLYKVLSAAVAMVAADSPDRRRIVSERTNYPSDLSIADTVAREHGFEHMLVDADEIPRHLDDRLAVLLLTHVNYQSGRMHPMGTMTRAAHDAGALMIWDGRCGAGEPLRRRGAWRGGRLRGGLRLQIPQRRSRGAGLRLGSSHPHRAHRSTALAPPLSGWLGHAAPFAFTIAYRPGAGISRFICGTPPVLSLAALECGVHLRIRRPPRARYRTAAIMKHPSAAPPSLLVPEARR